MSISKEPSVHSIKAIYIYITSYPLHWRVSNTVDATTLYIILSRQIVSERTNTFRVEALEHCNALTSPIHKLLYLGSIASFPQLVLF